MFRIKTWIPVEIDPEEDMLYSREAAEKEKAQLEEMQPENRYEIEEVVVDLEEKEISFDDFCEKHDIRHFREGFFHHLRAKGIDGTPTEKELLGYWDSYFGDISKRIRKK